MKKTLLVLSDGTTYHGWSFGAEGETTGEVVFNTSMTGYQEVLTDPSYKGQMVAMTYPEIGNYGLNEEDFESSRIQVEGFIVRKRGRSRRTGERAAVSTTGCGRRAWSASRDRHPRAHDEAARSGSLIGIISTEDLDPASLVQKARRAPSIEGRDLVAEVTCKAAYKWEVGDWDLKAGYSKPAHAGRYKVAAYDCGIKYNILRRLTAVGCDVTVVPASTTAEEVLALNPDGVFLSNGPGDPAAVPYVAESVRALLGRKPIFGICLGNQILASRSAR